MPVATSEISQGVFYLGDFIFLMCSNILSQGDLRVHKQNRNKVIEYFIITLYNMAEWLNGRRGPTIYTHLLILAHFTVLLKTHMIYFVTFLYNFTYF